MIKKIHIPDNLTKKLKNKKKLSAPIKEKFYWCLDMLIKNPQHPSLRNKTIKGTLIHGNLVLIKIIDAYIEKKKRKHLFWLL